MRYSLILDGVYLRVILVRVNKKNKANQLSLCPGWIKSRQSGQKSILA